MRLAFSRVYLGEDALGRPGNFCAHVIAGRREELRVEDIAQRIGSPFWWRGEDLDKHEAGAFSLSTVTIDDIQPYPLPEPDQDALAALLEALMVPATRLPWLVSCQAEQLASMIAALAGRMRGVLETFPFSTYEAADAAADFYIVGAANLIGPVNATSVPARPHLSCPDNIRRARSIVLSDKPSERSTVSLALGAGTSPDGSVSLARSVRLINLFDQLDGGCRVGTESLIPALSRPQSAAILLGIPTAIEIVADEMVDDYPDMWTILGSSASEMPDEILRKLGREVGSRAASSAGSGGPADPGHTTVLGTILLRAGDLPVAFSAACDDVILTEMEGNPGLVPGIGAEPRLRLLLAAARSRRPLAADALLAEPEDCLTISDTRELPVEWRARVLAKELARNPRRIAPLAERLRKEAGLAGPLVAALHGVDPLMPVLSAMSLGERVGLVTSACRSLAFDDMHQLVRWIAPQLTAAQCLDLIVQLPRLLEHGPTDPQWGTFIADLVRSCVEAALKAADLSLIDDLRVILSSVADPRVWAWNQLVSYLFAGRSGTQASLTPTWAEKGVTTARALTEPADFTAGVDLIVYVALTKHAPAAELTCLAQDLGPYLSGGVDEAAWRILVAACRMDRHRRRDIPLVPCLLMIARLIGDNRIATRYGGALRNKDAQRRSEALLARLPHSERVKLGEATARLGLDAVRWWYSISEPAGALRRGARRSRLGIGRSHLS